MIDNGGFKVKDCCPLIQEFANENFKMMNYIQSLLYSNHDGDEKIIIEFE